MENNFKVLHCLKLIGISFHIWGPRTEVANFLLFDLACLWKSSCLCSALVPWLCTVDVNVNIFSKHNGDRSCKVWYINLEICNLLISYILSWFASINILLFWDRLFEQILNCWCCIYNNYLFSSSIFLEIVFEVSIFFQRCFIVWGPNYITIIKLWLNQGIIDQYWRFWFNFVPNSSKNSKHSSYFICNKFNVWFPI